MIKLILKIFPRTLLIKFSFIFQPLLGLLLRGDKFTDPIDGKSFRKFLSYGYNESRKNALSPSTLSLERHRLLWLYLKNETTLFEKKIKLLHFAPEQAFYRRFKKLSNIQYDTIDINSPLAKIKADICDLPINDNSYDFIISSNMIHHVPFPSKFFNEMKRILKPGGKLIIQEINCSLVMRYLLKLMRHEGYDFEIDVFNHNLICTDPHDLWSANCAIPNLLFDDDIKFEN